MEFFFGGWIFLAEIAWTIYGNFIIYDPEWREQCDEDLPEGQILTSTSLFVTCIVLLCYGYILMVSLCCGCCFYFAFFSGKSAWDKMEKDALQATSEVKDQGFFEDKL